MSSSALIGDKRWAPSRKGMTVLGKVPKPINLPSQRLENHGLDPNVEIVPKGTLTWGSRPSAPPNAWGSSTCSPSSADGSIGSPGQHNGRPSSGGTGTRPSTAGSDRSSEPVANAWASPSRPSSASGILPSNQAPLAGARPRSAETRSASSHLSRFAEPIPENSIPWNAGAVGLLGPTSRTSDFALCSGDFPTLGSGKNSEIHEQQAGGQGSHGHPLVSAMPSTEKKGLNSPKGTASGAHAEKENSNAWKVGTHPCKPGSLIANIDRWPMDLRSNQPSSDTNLNSHHYGCHGPPPGPPDGIYYGDMPPGSNGPVHPPVNYLSEPFAYSTSQHTARPGPNSPRPLAISGGYIQKKEESFHSTMISDSYTMPFMPVRPGIYTNAVPYDGYYGPPHASFSTSSEKDRSVGGMAAPGICAQSSNQNNVKDVGKFGGRSGAPIPMTNDVEGIHSLDSRTEHRRVLLRNHGTFDVNGAKNNKGHLNAISLPPASMEMDSWEEVLEAEHNCFELGKTARSGACSVATRGRPAEATEILGMPSPSKVRVEGNCQVQRDETVTPPSDVLNNMKKSTLIEKIEGLNNKVRVTEGRSEAVIIPCKGERQRRIRSENVDDSTRTMQTPSANASKGPIETDLIGSRSTLHEDLESIPKRKSSGKSSGHSDDVKEEAQQSAIISAEVPITAEMHPNIHAEHTKCHFSHDKSDRYSKPRSSDSESRRMRTPTAELPPSIGVTIKLENGSEVDPISGHLVDDKVKENALPLDSSDYKRAKMKEMAVQRAKQLQKEEEERIREQKAKALAKLEELDRRKLEEASAQKVDFAPDQSNGLHQDKGQVVVCLQKLDATETASGSSSTRINDDSPFSPGSMAVLKNNKRTNTVVQSQAFSGTKGASVAIQKVDSAIINQISFGTVQTHNSKNNSVESLPIAQKCEKGFGKPKAGGDILHMVSHTGQYVPGNSTSLECSISDENCNETSLKKSNQYAPDNTEKHRHTGRSRRNGTPQEKIVAKSPLVSSDAAGPHAVVVVAESTSAGDGLIKNSAAVSGSTLKKKTRSARPKSKSEKEACFSMPTSQVQSEGILEKPSESCKTEVAVPIEPAISVPSQNTGECNRGQDSKEDVKPVNSGGSGSTEGHGKPTTQWKQHLPRRTRNGQSRSSDKFRGSEGVVWAPKVELPDEEYHAKYQDSSFKSGVDSLNSKYKRAEMERYVPKFVAKDTSENKNAEKALPSVPSTTDDASKKTNDGKGANGDVHNATVLSSELTVKTGSMEVSRPNKHARGHASWRQRSPERYSEATNSVPKHSNCDVAKTEVKARSSSQSHSDLNVDGNNYNNTMSIPPCEPVMTEVKNQGMPNRKHQAQRMRKSVEVNSYVAGANLSQNASADKPKMHGSSVCLDGSDGKILRSENAGQVDRMRSLWKPKLTQPFMTPNQDPSSRDPKSPNLVKESSVQASDSVIDADAEGKQTLQSGNGSMETGNFQRYQARRERNTMVETSKDPSIMSDKDSSNLVEQDPMKTCPNPGQYRPHDVHSRKGQEVSLGLRYNRGKEAHYGGQSSDQDGACRNLASTGDRQRQNSQYEYQRVETYFKSNDEQEQNASAENNIYYGNSRDAGPRYKERGHPRRTGQFYARSGAPVQ